MGRSERHVRERLALLELPEPAQQAIDEGAISLADAKVLVVVKDHPDVIEEVVEARPADVAWAVKQRLRRQAAEQRRAELAAEHEAAGVPVVEDEGHRPTGYVVVADLGVDEDGHADEPCHAVVIADRHDGPHAIAVCTERRRHTKSGASEVKAQRRDDDGRAAEREQARERKRVAAARREFVAQRLGRRLPKGPGTAFVIRTLLDRANANDQARAGELLGLEAVPGPYGDMWAPALWGLVNQGDPEASRVGVAIAVAMAEARIASQVGMPDLGRVYLEFLAELGYGLDPFELDAMSPRPCLDADGGTTAEAEDAA